MATMKTGMIYNIRGSNDNWRVIRTRFDGLVFQISLLHFIFDTGSVVFK